jgi:trimethylamine--corrinoid protein Co-methyltransferase
MNKKQQQHETSACPIILKERMKIKLHSQEDLEAIHQASMTVLHRTGVRFPSEKALKIFADAGAEVDFETKIVKIPPDLLMASISKAPREYTMASRGSKKLDLLLDGNGTYIGNAGTGMKTSDLASSIVRQSIKNDVADMARITDYLPTCSYYWPMVSAQDVPIPLMPLHELDAAFNNTQKHVHIISCVKEKQARHAIELIKVVGGGSENTKKRPPASLLICPVSPLGQDKESLETALMFAKAGLPVGVATMPTLGATAPASVAGTLVQGNAEILSTICYIQLVHPGAPVYYSFFSVTMNPYTGGCMSSSTMQHLLHGGVSQLGHFYDLPVMCGYGAGDTHTPGTWRHGKDSAVDAFFVMQTGPDLVPNMGLIELYTLMHYESILLENEVVNSLMTMAGGIQVDTRNLAVDEIHKVGPGGHYLGNQFTVDNMRELWNPGIAHQWDPKKTDFRDPLEAAKEKIKWILKNHQPIPLEDKMQQEMKKIISAAEKDLL